MKILPVLRLHLLFLSQMEEDPLAVSTSISVKLESNFERPQFDLTVSSNEGKVCEHPELLHFYVY